MARILRVAWLVQAGVLLLAWPVSAQVKFGEVSAKSNGTISSGYTATSGNLTNSTHGWTVGGAATLTGSYHNPNFLSFSVSPFLNQSRANSNFQSISDASGVNATVNLFSGGNFPGSVNYSKTYNSEGNYAVPGLANFVTRGNSDSVGINWSENVPDVPSVSAGFQYGTSKYSVYGTNDNGTNSFHSLNLHSGYTWAGFNMGAYYTKGGGHSLIPEIVTGLSATEIQSDNSAYGFNVSHRLPLQGSVSTNLSRSTWNTDYLGYSSSGTINMVNSLAAIHPTEKLSFSATANYSDNLTGQLFQAIAAVGGVLPGFNSNATSNSLDLEGVAGYTPVKNMQTSAFVERRTQTFLGQDYGVQTYGGSMSYGHPLFRGTFNAAAVVTANTADKTGQDNIGFSTNENYSTEIRGWNLTGSFGYAQNAQTLLITYLNSFFNYSVTARRQWGDFNLTAGAGGGRTALTNQPGTANSSQGYNAGMGYRSWIMATGSYSKADGQALVTGSGLVPVPVPSPTLPSNLLSVYGGNGYSFGLSSNPVKRLILVGTYAKSTSDTLLGTVDSSNHNTQANTYIQYQFRKMYFTSGYSRLEQGFSQSGTTPEVLSSYYFGVSRWFNFF